MLITGPNQQQLSGEAPKNSMGLRCVPTVILLLVTCLHILQS